MKKWFFIWVILFQIWKRRIGHENNIAHPKVSTQFPLAGCQAPGRTLNISLLPDGMILSSVCEGWRKSTGVEGVFLWPGFWRANGFSSAEQHGWLLLAWFLQHGQLYSSFSTSSFSNTHCLQHEQLFQCQAFAAWAASLEHGFLNMQLFWCLASAVWMVSPLPGSHSPLLPLYLAPVTCWSAAPSGQQLPLVVFSDFSVKCHQQDTSPWMASPGTLLGNFAVEIEPYCR